MNAYNGCDYKQTEKGYLLMAKPESDMVVDPMTGTVVSNAVYMADDVEGDFTFSACVSHEFSIPQMVRTGSLSVSCRFCCRKR